MKAISYSLYKLSTCHVTYSISFFSCITVEQKRQRNYLKLIELFFLAQLLNKLGYWKIYSKGPIRTFSYEKPLMKTHTLCATLYHEKDNPGTENMFDHFGEEDTRVRSATKTKNAISMQHTSQTSCVSV